MSASAPAMNKWGPGDQARPAWDSDGVAWDSSGVLGTAWDCKGEGCGVCGSRCSRDSRQSLRAILSERALVSLVRLAS